MRGTWGSKKTSLAIAQAEETQVQAQAVEQD